MLEWTLPSESKPRKCSAFLVFLAVGDETSTSSTRTARRTQWIRRRALHPGSRSGRSRARCGQPRSCPCRRRWKTDGSAVRLEPRHGAGGHQLSRFGVFACFTASPGPPSPRPTPSINFQYDRFFHLYILHIGFILLVSFVRAYSTPYCLRLQCQFSICRRKICSFASA